MKFRKSIPNIHFVKNERTEDTIYYWIRNFTNNNGLWVIPKTYSREEQIKEGIEFKRRYPNYQTLGLICHPIFRGLL
jgi:hypothetical protein